MRPRPVLIYGCVMAVLIVLTTSADAANVLPDTVLIWIRLATAILGGVGGALFVQGQVTPLSDPRTKNGLQSCPLKSAPGRKVGQKRSWTALDSASRCGPESPTGCPHVANTSRHGSARTGIS